MPPPTARSPLQSGDSDSDGGALPTSAFEITPQKLQHRLDMLMIEFNEVKAAAERWKREKEEAEKERDVERAQRESLSEMVEKLRAEEAERSAKLAKRNARRRQREYYKDGRRGAYP